MTQRALMAPTTTQSGYTIVFDGGSLGNPGRGYGSYVVANADGVVNRAALSYDDRGSQVTNNQAEYWTLIAALQWLSETLDGRGPATPITVLGDSLLVINQLLGKWKVKNEGLRPLHAEARELLKRFGPTELRWHDRGNSVRILGH